MNKLKVGFVFDDSLDRTDGIQQYLTTVGRWLLQQGHDVHFLVGETRGGPFPERTHSLSRNFTVHGNGNVLSIPLPANKRRIKDLLAREQFAILHVQVPYNPLLAGRVITAAHPNTPIVGTFHIAAERPLTIKGAHLMGSLQQRSLRKFTSVVSVSEAARDFAKQHYCIDSTILPNTVELPQLHTRTHKQNKTPRLVFLGRLVERKGCQELLQAFSLIKMDPLPELIICGDGEERPSLEQLAAALRIDTRVTFMGRVDETDKYLQLSSADLAVFPSLHGESFGIVLLEAMATDNPVVLAGDNAGYRSVLKDQAEYMLIDPRDHSLFARRMEVLLSDTKLRAELLQWQQQRLQDFTISSVGPQIVEWYERAIQQPTPN